MTNTLFRALSSKEIISFRQFARREYKVGEAVNQLWHPAAKLECELMNFEDVQKKAIGNKTILFEIRLKIKIADEPAD